MQKELFRLIKIKTRWQKFKRSRHRGKYVWNEKSDGYITLIDRDRIIDELIKIAELALGNNDE